jgi:hypothetical protein
LLKLQSSFIAQNLSTSEQWIYLKENQIKFISKHQKQIKIQKSNSLHKTISLATLIFIFNLGKSWSITLKANAARGSYKASTSFVAS